MTVTAPPTVDALPAAPDPNDMSTFNTLAYPFTAAWGPYRSQMSALAANVYANALDAAASASAAAAQAATATAAAASASATAGALPWVNGANYAFGENAISLANAKTYRRIIAGAGTTDPALDPVNWRAVGLSSQAFYHLRALALRNAAFLQ